MTTCKHVEIAAVKFMGDLRLLISHGGQWFGQNYEGGDFEMAFVPPNLTYDGLIKTVEDIVTFDSSSFSIELRDIMNTSGRRTIVRIKNNRDVSFLIEGTPPEFETNTDHGLDNLDEQYPFTEDEAFVDFIVEEDNREGVNCGSPNFEGDSGGESDASNHSHSSGYHDDDLVGNTTTQMELKRELSLMALKQHFEFRIKRSSKARFEATCKDDNCSFRVYARKMDEGECLQIRKFDKEHSCTIEGFQGRFRQANSSIIGELVSPELPVNGIALKPKDIMTEMQLHYGVHIQYTKGLASEGSCIDYCVWTSGRVVPADSFVFVYA
ncbi:hypothetical protein Dsin_019647 [Dipteronia sinensis]|uniref:Transposase MuDR plant domain-containing protein n=1 Tax=Dipteronia sinensis TaxID=43782 RepID=A0AAE0E388_9ROSI|nr:hypothetical protein Dsin_019647 [Dipteronia sinensis]